MTRGKVDWRAIAEMLWNVLPDHGVPEDCRPDPDDCRYCAAFRAYRAALSADNPSRGSE